MKKACSFFLAMLLAFSVAGCGPSTAPSSSAPPDSQPSASGSSADASSQAQEQPKETIKIKAAFHPNLGPMTIPGIEDKMGYFKEEGLEIEWLKFTAGAPEIAAMVSGDLHFGYIGNGALALCAQGQAEVISISHYTNSEAILVRASSGIKTMKDLVGKQIATEVGTNADAILDMACERESMSVKDLNVINMPMSNAVAAFIGGSVDCIVAWGADLTNIKNTVSEEIYTVAQTSEFLDVVPFIGSWIANGEFVKENPDTVQRFIRGLNKCYDYRSGHLDETIQASADFAKKSDIGVTYDDLNSERDQLVFFSVDQEKEWLGSGKIEQDFQRQLDFMVKTGKVENGDIFSYVRFDLMKQALGIQ